MQAPQEVGAAVRLLATLVWATGLAAGTPCPRMAGSILPSYVNVSQGACWLRQCSLLHLPWVSPARAWTDRGRSGRCPEAPVLDGPASQASEQQGERRNEPQHGLGWWAWGLERWAVRSCRCGASRTGCVGAGLRGRRLNPAKPRLGQLSKTERDPGMRV